MSAVPPHPEAAPAPRRRWAVALGFALALVAMVLGPLLVAPPLAVGIILATRGGRRAAGIAIVVTTVVLVAAPRIYLIAVLGGKGYRIPSASMEPTLRIRDRVYGVDDDTPERGDLYVFHPPAGALEQRCGVPKRHGRACPDPTPGTASLVFIKRIVGLPGDRLKVVRNRVVIDGRPLREPYIHTSPCVVVCNLRREIVIPPGHYFMVGDNRGQSDDSRDWGPVPKDALLKRVVFRYLPLSRLGSL